MLFWLAFKKIGSQMRQTQTSKIITYIITVKEAELHRIEIAWKKINILNWELLFLVVFL